MIGVQRGMTLDPLFSFDGKEESAVQINLSVQWGRKGRRVLLDITQPVIRELIARKDQRLFDLLGELAEFGLREIEEAINADDEEDTEAEIEDVPKTKPGYIYLLKSADGYYKIGCSQNVQSRMKAFSTQLPHPPELLHTIPAGDMYRAEEGLHKRYAHCRVRGEWFALAEEDVRAICAITDL